MSASARFATLLSIVLAAAGLLRADTVKTTDGHVLTGAIGDENDTEMTFNLKKISVRKKAIREFGFETAADTGSEFFAKLELKDGSKIVGWVEKTPEGVLVKKHAIFGENHPVTQKEIRRLTPIGKMRIVADFGTVTGFVAAENPETMTLELGDEQAIVVKHSNVTRREPRRSKKKPARNDLPDEMLGLVGAFALPQGRLRGAVDRSFGGGLDYLRTLPDFMHWLGYGIISGRLQYFEGQNLKIYFGQLYAGFVRTLQFGSGHAVFGKLAGGINFQYMHDRDFTAAGGVAGAAAGLGYLFTRGKISVMAAGFYQYFYDKAYPLLGFGAELGVFYAL